MNQMKWLLVGVSVLAGACAGGEDGDGDGVASSATLMAVGGDYAGSGIASSVGLPDLMVTQNAVAGVVGGDPAIRSIGDKLFILDKFGGDTITILNQEDLTLVDQFSVGAGMNPQDVAVIDRRLYVAALDAGGLLVFDLDDPSADPTLVDLSSIDAEDGIPDCGSVIAVDDRLFVACGRFDRSDFPWVTRGVGVVAVVDSNDDSVTQQIELTNPNPFGWLESAGDMMGGDLLVSTVPDPFVDVTQGCVERISTDGDAQAMGCLVENSELGGYASAMTTSDETVWAVVTTAFDAGKVGSYAPGGDGWQIGGMLAEGSNPTDVVRCPTGHVVVADNSASGRGLRVFDVDGLEITDTPLDVGWPAAFLPTHSLACY